MIERERFDTLADALCAPRAGVSMVSLSLQAEASDFVRFNHARVRQATHTLQCHATLGAAARGRRADTTLALAGRIDADIAALRTELQRLLATLDDVPEDPFLLLPDVVASSTRDERGALPDAAQAIEAVATHAAGEDFVGFLASGPVLRAWADSRGQRNWHRVETFHFDWCLMRGAQAAKATCAGTHWSDAAFAAGMAQARSEADLLEREPLAVAPGRYRAWLAPAAVGELLALLAWNGFGIKARRTGTSSLTRLADGDAAFDARVQMTEATTDGIAPAFTAEGFTRPARVELVRDGRAADALTSPRSAREFGVANHGAIAAEAPESLELGAGTLAQRDALAALGDGLLLGHLWYLNYSDLRACRMTGMTRYACFVVRGGEIVAPFAPMRFDDSLLRLLGPGLVALGAERERIAAGETYERRRLASITTPGVLVEGLQLTL